MALVLNVKKRKRKILKCHLTCSYRHVLRMELSKGKRKGRKASGVEWGRKKINRGGTVKIRRGLLTKRKGEERQRRQWGVTKPKKFENAGLLLWGKKKRKKGCLPRQGEKEGKREALDTLKTRSRHSVHRKEEKRGKGSVENHDMGKSGGSRNLRKCNC